MKRVFFLLFVLYLSFNTFAQYTTPEVITSGGDSFIQTFGKMDVTIGESIIETYQGNSIYLTQGFQQGNIIVAAIEENDSDDAGTMQVFPNPTINDLHIVSDIDAQILIQLYDLGGKLLYCGHAIKETILDFSVYAAGSYLLKLESGKASKTYKIQKVK